MAESSRAAVESALFDDDSSSDDEDEAVLMGPGRIVRECEHHGWGVVARRQIKAGTVVIREAALLKSSNEGWDATRRPSQRYAKRLMALDSAQLSRLELVYPRSIDDAPEHIREGSRRRARQELERLQTNVGEEAVDSLARLFAVADLSSYSGGLFVEASFINHSSTPNCCLRHHAGVATVYATRIVERGRALTLNYLGDRETAHRGEVKALGKAHDFDAMAGLPPSVLLGDEESWRLADALSERVEAAEALFDAGATSTAVYAEAAACFESGEGLLGEDHVLWRRIASLKAAAALRIHPDDDPWEDRLAAQCHAASEALRRTDECPWLGESHPDVAVEAATLALGGNALLSRRAEAVDALYAPVATWVSHTPPDDDSSDEDGLGDLFADTVSRPRCAYVRRKKQEWLVEFEATDGGVDAAVAHLQSEDCCLVHDCKVPLLGSRTLEEVFDASSRDLTGQMREAGVAALRSAISAARLASLQRTVLPLIAETRRKLAALPEGTPERFKEVMRRSEGRYDLALDPDNFDDAPWLGTIKELLGPDFYLAKRGAVYSVPGATRQPWHADIVHPEAAPDTYGGKDWPKRPHAVCCFLPLIDLDDAVGFTSFWPGSHRAHQSKLLKHDLPDKVATLQAKVKAGDALLYDYSVIHRGEPNTSRMRPILYLIYANPGFKDAGNWATLSLNDLPLPASGGAS